MAIAAGRVSKCNGPAHCCFYSKSLWRDNSLIIAKFTLALFGLLPLAGRLRFSIRITCLASALWTVFDCPLLTYALYALQLRIKACKTQCRLLPPTLHCQNWGGTSKLQHHQNCKFGIGAGLVLKIIWVISTLQFRSVSQPVGRVSKAPTSSMQNVGSQ